MKATAGQKITIQQVNAYLASRGIPKQMVRAIREALILDAVVEGTDLKYDRIYTAVGIMLRKTYGFGAERIIRGIRAFDQICGSVLDEDEGGEGKDWTELMKWFQDETGIVIHTGADNRLVCESTRPSKDDEVIEV